MKTINNYSAKHCNVTASLFKSMCLGCFYLYPVKEGVKPFSGGGVSFRTSRYGPYSAAITLKELTYIGFHSLEIAISNTYHNRVVKELIFSYVLSYLYFNKTFYYISLGVVARTDIPFSYDLYFQFEYL